MTEETSLRENDSLNENRKNPEKELSFTEKLIIFKNYYVHNILRLLAKNGEADANFLSVWAFGYLDVIFSKGSQKPIQEWHAI